MLTVAGCYSQSYSIRGPDIARGMTSCWIADVPPKWCGSQATMALQQLRAHEWSTIGPRTPLRPLRGGPRPTSLVGPANAACGLNPTVPIHEHHSGNTHYPPMRAAMDHRRQRGVRSRSGRKRIGQDVGVPVMDETGRHSRPALVRGARRPVLRTLRGPSLNDFPLNVGGLEPLVDSSSNRGHSHAPDQWHHGG